MADMGLVQKSLIVAMQEWVIRWRELFSYERMNQMQSVVREFPVIPQPLACAAIYLRSKRSSPNGYLRRAKVYFLDDLVVYRAQGILSKAECCLVRDDPEGRR